MEADYEEDILRALGAAPGAILQPLLRIKVRNSCRTPYSHKVFFGTLNRLISEGIITTSTFGVRLVAQEPEPEPTRSILAEFGEVDLAKLKAQRDALQQDIDTLPCSPRLEGILSLCDDILGYYAEPGEDG